METTMSDDDSMTEIQNTLLGKRKSPIEISQTLNSSSSSYHKTLMETTMSNDSMEIQNILLGKGKSPIEISQTLNSNTSPNDEGFVWWKKAKLNPDETELELKKNPAHFKVESAVCWAKEERVPFMFMAKALAAITNEPDKSVVTGILCNLLRTVIETAPDDLLAVVYLLSKRIVPPHVEIDPFLENGHVQLAIADACDTEVRHIEKHFEMLGDFGLVAGARIPERKRGNPLTVVKVFETFKKLTKTWGSLNKKKDLLKELLVAATGSEAVHLIHLVERMFYGEKDLVLAEQTLLTALGHAALYSVDHYSPPDNVDNPEDLEEAAAKVVKEVYFVIPVYDKIVPALLRGGGDGDGDGDGGVWKLPQSCTITPGIPVKAMLPNKQKLGSISAILDKFQDREFTCEYEYPGQRILIHYMDGVLVAVYKESGHKCTENYIDIAIGVLGFKQPSVKSFILDCQLAAYDHEKDIILPSETFDKCRRAEIVDYSVQVCVYATDILYLNGEQLLQEQLQVRREYLYKSFREETGLFHFAAELTSKIPEQIDNFLDKAVNSSCPRLIIKTLTEDATYEAGKRSQNWFIYEKGYVEYNPPSLHLVPIAAYSMSDWENGVFNFLLACYDNVNEEFQAICTLGPWNVPKAILHEHYDRLQSKVIPIPKTNYKYVECVRPDLYRWLEPTEVWEVKVAGYYVSPTKNSIEIGTVDPIKGLLLSFPRLVHVLEDNDLKQASTPDKVVELYKEASKHSRK